MTRRTTIDFGIDLGTTNSTIAVIERSDAQVINNKVGSGTTPSAVWLDRRGNVQVGEEAKKRHWTDDNEADNSLLEFKQMMGMGPESARTFRRSGRTFKPEDLSAEVLKSLRNDARAMLSEEVTAAVITVPAAFENAATAATARAAKLAGIDNCPLLLEPVAASLAYGFHSEKDNVYWLVYDFGGGTFDAAVMRIRDGLIHVEAHEGDNALGGKLLDWDLVTELLAPAARAKFDLPDFRRDSLKWRSAFGRLKFAAEEAKIAVCRTRAASELFVEFEDAKGNTVDFSYVLTPDDIEAIARPYIQRTLNMCAKTLREARLEPGALERVLMVGGSTLNPWLRSAVEAQFKRPLDFSIDPVTVVARGAAFFASTIEIKAINDTNRNRKPGGSEAWRIEIGSKATGNVPDPDVAGRVIAPAGCSAAGHTIEFFEPMTKWRTGRINLDASGVFMTQLYAVKPGRYEYAIELCNPSEVKIATDPDSTSYTYGNVPATQPLAHTISVGLVDGSVAVYAKKGDPLPIKSRLLDHISTVRLRAGRSEDVLTIPLLEGESERARRNYKVGEIRITGADFSRDVSEGSQIEVAVSIDSSQTVTLTASVSEHERDYACHYTPLSAADGLARLMPQVASEQARLEMTRLAIVNAGLPEGAAILARVDGEDLVRTLGKLASSAAVDPGQLRALDRRVRELAGMIDDLDDLLEWPKLAETAASRMADAEGVVENSGAEDDKRVLGQLQADYRQAIETKNADAIRRNAIDFSALFQKVAGRDPSYHIGGFEYLVGMREQMSDKSQADQFIAQGRRAIAANNIDALKTANRQLWSMLKGVVGMQNAPDRHQNVGATWVPKR